MHERVGRFRLKSTLGEGGMGRVFRAEDPVLGRDVALKLLPRARCDDVASRERLLREGRAAAGFSHPNLAALFEAGEVDGEVYLAMELAEGDTVAERLARTGPLPVRTAVAVAREIASALSAMHAASLVHGDVTPRNVVLSADGTPKLVDFGLSRSGAADRDEAGDVAGGTVGYAPPERLAGAALEASADVFGLGAVLYEMVAGERAFPGPGPTAIRDAVLRAAPKPLTAHRDGVPLALESAVRGALARSPRERPASMEAFRRELEQVAAALDGESASAGAAAGTVPFRGLSPFVEGDADRFFGREEEVSALVARIEHRDFRFGVVYGESGAGKTSLLRAGLSPRLRARGLVPLYARAAGDVVSSLIAECRKWTGVAPLPGEPPATTLARASERARAPVVAIVDQLEELWGLNAADAAGEAFAAFAVAVHDDARGRTRLLVAVRNESLHLVASRLGGRLPEPLAVARLFRLTNLSEERAAEIIERSAGQAGLALEAGLARHVAADLAVHGAVLPAELQIVGEELHRRGLLTRRSYDRAGRKDVLLQLFLDEVLESAGDRDAAGLLLRCLVSEDGTRVALSLDEVLRRTQRDRRLVVRLLRHLESARIVRELPEESPVRYELMHDALVPRVNRAIGRVLDATARANRLLRQHLANAAVEPKTSIPLRELLAIRRYADLPLGDRERALLSRSARVGLVRAGAVLGAALVAGTVAAAALSVRDEWRGVALRDGHSAAARLAVFSPDGRTLASVGEDGRVILWDFERRVARRVLQAHGGPVYAAAFSPDGTRLATGGQDGVVVWDVADAAVENAFDPGRGSIHALAFSPDGRSVASVGMRGGELRDLEDGTAQPLPVSFAHGSIAFTSGGSRIDVTTGESVAIDDGICVSWWGAGSTGAFADSFDATHRVWIDNSGAVTLLERETGRVLSRNWRHRDHGRAAAYSPDGRYIATGAEDVVLWDAARLAPIARLQFPSVVWSLAYSRDGETLVSTHGDGSIVLWDPDGRERIGGLSGHVGPVHTVAFSPDGRFLVSGGEDRDLAVWDLARSRRTAVFRTHGTPILGAAFSRDGLVASASVFDRVCVHDPAGLRTRWCFESPLPATHEPTYAVAFSPDGAVVASSNRVFRTSDGVEIAHLVPHLLRSGLGRPYALAFSPDGSTLFGATDGGQIVGLETAGWTLQNVFQASPRALVALGLSRSGETLAAAGDEGVVVLLASRPLGLLGALGRHGARVKAVAYSPDGRTVASAGDDRELRLWDVGRRRAAGTVGVHTAPIRAVAFSSDGRLLATGEQDATVRVYGKTRHLWGHVLEEASR